MILKLRLLIPLFVCFWHLGFSQNLEESINTTDIASMSFLDRTEFKASYFGNIFWNNGISLGAEYFLKEIVKVKNRKRGQRTNTHQFLLNGNLGFTTNFASQTDTGIFTNYGITWRRTNKKGKQFSIEFNPLGYYRSFYPQTFEVNGENVEKVTLPGRGYHAPSLSVGIGKQRNGKKISGRYFNINFMLRNNFNATSLPAFSFQYGYRFNFKKKKEHANNI